MKLIRFAGGRQQPAAGVGAGAGDGRGLPLDCELAATACALVHGPGIDGLCSSSLV